MEDEKKSIAKRTCPNAGDSFIAHKAIQRCELLGFSINAANATGNPRAKRSAPENLTEIVKL